MQYYVQFTSNTLSNHLEISELFTVWVATSGILQYVFLSTLILY